MIAFAGASLFALDYVTWKRSENYKGRKASLTVSVSLEQRVSIRENYHSQATTVLRIAKDIYSLISIGLKSPISNDNIGLGPRSCNVRLFALYCDRYWLGP